MVANFISSLIVLFERPFRVGNTVTVGEVHGMVDRIRIRATTTEGWDLKELIAPNKDFIAGQLISWSLSDKIARIGYWLALSMVPIGRHYDCISPA
jgi:potassium efflux system protein